MDTPSIKRMKRNWREFDNRGRSFKQYMRDWASKDDGDPVTYAYAAARWLERKRK